MQDLMNKIEKNIKAIAKAESMGRDSTDWQEYVMKLIKQFSFHKVRVKVGQFGFCTCSEEGSVCFGCRNVTQSCVCKKRAVNPEEEMKRQYNVKKIRVN